MKLKEYKVTVYPRPRSYTVMAETPIQAERVADQNYIGERPILDDIAYRHDVEEVIEELKNKADEIHN